ncbi:MAG: cell division/cell wall cluster transcriptional repressor MraZ [Candidatus Muproteobacteria bacterium RBG_16_64_10]|uniref:Transcriptional regulator MraZ n=1 Tax=Candidatus Muproteobacteria bacterium RBG_16_64_10 TaxID=1817757 RepID=A0A1F6SXH8_9PROT|nr:MAG: cell division/cell wall cluster transcriptional repressor MraZ [Candidatus Muproteobacteria bacterium RBG_16_64_10]
MFRGVNNLALDSKGRLAIPVRYRDTLARHCNGQMVLTVDRDHCLLLYPLPEWEEIERKLVKLPSLSKPARRLQRLLIGHATECELDAAGRILLTPPLREFASLVKTIVLIGQGNKFEIWDETTWNVRRAEWLAQSAEDEGELPPDMESISL